MKKLIDSKFLFIVALSLIVLIILGIGAFYLFDDSDAVFVKSGYVLNPLSAKNEKYFFDENTSYKENLSSMIEFKDTDDVEVTILKDSFIHYMDGSMSFLKNGAILDLDSIEGTKAVDFYNITNKSLIEKVGKRYSIASQNGDINLNNFIGRISDSKYIVAGNLEAKIPGNNTNIQADYFEIVYTEEGIINIENKDNKFQVTAEGTIIYAGDVVIDLGNKKITKAGEDVMSITAITIDGNENIEIIPKAPEPSASSASEEAPIINPTPALPSQNNQGEGANDNPGEGVTEAISVNLRRVTTGSTYANLLFDIKNQTSEDSFNLKVTNLDTGRTVQKYDNVNPNVELPVEGLTPGTKYLFTLENNKDGGKYSQKLIETKGFGITFERSYVTDDSLGYKISVSEDSDVRDAVVTLMKYDESSKQLKPVVATYIDGEGNEITRELKYNLSDLEGGAKGTHEISFDGMLDSNTLYTAVLKNVAIGGGNYETYDKSLTDLTLKKTPDYSNLNAIEGVDKKSFKLEIGGIVDPDNAIVSYTYRIYEKSDLENPVINEIVRNDASPIEVPFGNCANCLKNDDDGKHKYVYRVVIKYFDNEKEVDFVTSDSFGFSMGTDPYITVVPTDDARSYNSIGAKVYILDNSCTIAMPNRTECNGVNSARVRISYNNGSDKQTYLILDEEQCGFTATDNEISCEFHLDNLAEGTKYYVDVWAVRQDHNVGIAEEIEHTSDSVKFIKTKSLSEFSVDWDLNNSQAKSNSENVIYIDPKLVRTDDDDDSQDVLSPGETANAIQKVRIQLYEGDDVSSVQYGLKDPIASFIVDTTDENIKENFYDKRYLVTLDKFGLSYDPVTNSLVTADNRSYKLKEYYTIALSAYYDKENAVRLNDAITPYKVSPLLFIDDLEDSNVLTTPIRNDENRGIDSDLINNYLDNQGTIIGYTVIPSFDRQGLAGHNFTPEKIRYFVRNADGEDVDFYVVDGNTVSRVSYYETTDLDNPMQNIYMAYGRDYVSDDDKLMHRGETYFIGFSLGIDIGSSSIENGTSALSKPVTALKEEPSVLTYAYTSSADSITYAYSVKDPDRVIYKNGDSNEYSFYYVTNDVNEKRVLITRVPGDYNTFEGEDLTLTGLDTNNTYKLYYKSALSISGNYNDDISEVYVAESENGRLFDGLWDADDYDFSYEVINNQEIDNKVSIKILTEDIMLKRMTAYQVNLTSPLGNYSRDDLVLTECDDDGSIRCLSIDYIDIKRLKSEIGHENLITVSVNAFYDTGLTGFGFDVGEDKDKKYMIFQNNNANGEAGRYATFSKRGIITNWVDDINVPKGVYKYSFVSHNDTDKILYESLLANSYNSSFDYVVNENGYIATGVTIGTLNPKIVEKQIMSSTKNTFSFYSITPTLTVNRLTRVINGAVINMNLTNVDTEILRDFCDTKSGSCVSNPSAQKHLYIETWASEEDAAADTDFSLTVREKLEVDLRSDPRTAVDALLFELNNDTTYYYRVYAYMNKDGQSVYTQLFYNTKEKRTYSFKSLSSSELFRAPLQDENNRPLDYVIDTDAGADYADKKLKTSITLDKYKNSVPFNFKLGYALCDTLNANEEDNCGIGDDNAPIFKKIIDTNTLIDGFVDSDKLDDYVSFDEYGLNDLVFGKTYRVNMYAIFDYYDKSLGRTIEKVLPINRQNNIYSLRKLDKPVITATRKASYDSINNDYVIDISVAIGDSSRIMDDGKYYIKLLDTTDDKNVVGKLQVKDGGNWRTIGEGNEYIELENLKILNAGEDIRISGLPNPSTSYELIIYNTGYLNNADEETPHKMFEKSYAVYTSEYESNVAFGNISLATTESSLEIRFIGGSNLVEHVCSLDCTIKEIDANNREVASYPLSYSVGTQPGDKTFDENTGNWRFIVDGGGLSFNETSTYNAKIVIKTCDPDTGNVDKTFEIERTDITYAEGQTGN